MRRRRAGLLHATSGIALGALLPQRLVEAAPVRTFVVDKATGSDSNAGGELAPWASLQDYLSGTAGPSNNIAPTPGDLVLVKDYPNQDGTLGQASIGYRPPTGFIDHVISNRSGLAAAPITVRAWPGHRPVVLGQNVAPGDAAKSRCLRLSGTSSYWRFSGFEFPYSAGSGANEPCVYPAGTSHHFEFFDCWFHGATDGSGQVNDSGTHHGHFVNCRFYANNDWRGGSNQSHGCYIIGSDYLLLNCLAYRQAAGYGIQIRAGAKRTIVANCTSAYNDGSVAEFAGVVIESDASGTNDNLVVNTIVYHNRRGIHALAGTGFSGNRSRRNLAGANVTSTFTNGTAGSGWDWSSDGSGNYTPPGDNLVGDPLFADAANNDFSLQAGSPAFGAADPNYCPSFDVFNNARHAATIGAERGFEEVS